MMLYIVLYSILVVLLFDSCLNTPFAVDENSPLLIFLFSVVF